MKADLHIFIVYIIFTIYTCITSLCSACMFKTKWDIYDGWKFSTDTVQEMEYDVENKYKNKEQKKSKF